MENFLISDLDFEDERLKTLIFDLKTCFPNKKKR